MESYFPLLIGFFGAIIGAAASITAVFVQAKSAERRHKMRLAAELALEDYKLRLPLIEKFGSERPPLPVFLDYYLSLVAEIDAGTIDSKRIVELRRRNDRLMEAFRNLADYPLSDDPNEAAEMHQGHVPPSGGNRE